MRQRMDKIRLIVILAGFFFDAISTNPTQPITPNLDESQQSFTNSTSSNSGTLAPNNQSSASQLTTHDNDTSPLVHFQHLVVAVEPTSIMELIESTGILNTLEKINPFHNSFEGDKTLLVEPAPIILTITEEIFTTGKEEPVGENKTSPHNSSKGEMKMEKKDGDVTFLINPGSDSNATKPIDQIQHSPSDLTSKTSGDAAKLPASVEVDNLKETTREDRDLDHSDINLKSETCAHNGKLEGVEEKLKNKTVDDAVIREVLESLIGSSKVEEIMPKTTDEDAPIKSKRSTNPDKSEKQNFRSQEIEMNSGAELQERHRSKRSNYGETSSSNSVPSGQIPELIPSLMPGVRLSSYEITTNSVRAPADVPTRSTPVYQYAFRTRPVRRNLLKSTSSYGTTAVRSSSYDAPATRSSSYNAPATRSSVFDAPAIRSSSYDAPAIRSSSYDAPATRLSSYDAPAVRSSSYDAPAIRLSSYDAPAVRSSSYDAPAIRLSSYDAPAVRSSSYDAPAIRLSSYDAPAVRSSSYDAPAIRSASYDVPAIRSANYDAPTIRSSSYDAPAIRSSSYDAPAIRSSSYDAPAIRSPSYDAPAIRSSSYDDPAIRSSSYDAPATRLSSYDAPIVRTFSFDTPSTRSSKYSTDLSDLPVSRDFPFVRIATSADSSVRSSYDTPATRSSYDTPATRSSYDTPATRSSYDTPATRSSYDTPATRSSYDTPATRFSYDTPATRSSYDTPDTRSSSDVPAVREFQTVRMTYEYDIPMQVFPQLASPEVRSDYGIQDVPESNSNYDSPADVPDTRDGGNYPSDTSSDEPLTSPIRVSYDMRRRKRSTASKEISKRRVPMVLSTVSRISSTGGGGPF